MRDRTPERRPITELDILAYADGQLERDPLHRAAVERHLAAHPDQAARAEDFRAQNEALRRAGERWLAEPVPQHLLDLLYAEPPSRHRPLLRTAAALALLVAGAGGGWLAGVQNQADRNLDHFAELALLDHSRQAVGSGGLALASTGRLPAHDLPSPELTRQGLAPVAWRSGRVALEVEAPDLANYGYELVGQQRVLLEDEAAVRLSYRSADGRSAYLYLRPRWQETAAPVQRLSDGELTVLHWLEGPLAIALTAERAAPQEAEALAGAVRRAVETASLAEPAAGLGIAAGKQPAIAQDARLTEPEKPTPGRLDGLVPIATDPKL